MCCGRDKKEKPEIKNRPVEIKNRNIEINNDDDLKKNGKNFLEEEDNQYVRRHGEK